MGRIVSRTLHAAAAVAAGALGLAHGSAVAQRAWPEVLRVAPCPPIPMRVDGQILSACGGRFDLQTTRYVRTPYEAIATIGDGALVAPDEERRGGGLAVDRTPAGPEPALGERVARAEGPASVLWAVSPDGARVATMELRDCNEQGACTTEIVERSLPALRELSRTRLTRPPIAIVYVVRGLAVLDGATIRLVAGTELARLTEVPRADPILAFSADGSLVAYVARDHTVRVVLTDGGALVGRLPVRDVVERLAVSTGGRRIALGTPSDTIVLGLVRAVPPDRALGPVVRLAGHARELALTDTVLATVNDDDELVVRAEHAEARAALPPAPDVVLPLARDFEPYSDGSSERHAQRLATLAPAGTRGSGNAVATATIDVYDGRDLAGAPSAVAWAASAAERFGPVEYSTTPTGRSHTLRVTRDDAAGVDAEVEGFGNGCDPWPVWILLKRRGDRVIRVELGYEYSIEPTSARLRDWQRALRAVDFVGVPAAASPAVAPRARPRRRSR